MQSQSKTYTTLLAEFKTFHDYGAPIMPAYAQELLEQVRLRDVRLLELEHALASYRDFMLKPTIAGDAYDAISIYANALHARTKRLLGEED